MFSYVILVGFKISVEELSNHILIKANQFPLKKFVSLQNFHIDLY